MEVPQHEYFYLVPLTLSAIFCLKAFRQKWPKPYRLYAAMVIITLLTEVTAITWPYQFKLHEILPQNNFWIYNLYITVRFGLLAAIFYQLLKRPVIRKILPPTAIVIIAMAALDYTLIHGPLYYNTYSMIVTHLCIIALCLIYFQQLLQDMDTTIIYKEPFVWMALSIFLYHAVSLPFLIMLGIFNMTNSKLAVLFFPINEILNFLLCSSYLISFLWKPHYTRSH
jgi:hypothetical protein